MGRSFLLLLLLVATTLPHVIGQDHFVVERGLQSSKGKGGRQRRGKGGSKSKAKSSKTYNKRGKGASKKQAGKGKGKGQRSSNNVVASKDEVKSATTTDDKGDTSVGVQFLESSASVATPQQGTEGSTVDADDLNIRFNKIAFIGIDTPRFMPLRADDYPFDDALARFFKQERQVIAISIVTADDPELTDRPLESYLAQVGGIPSMPTNRTDHEFWEEMHYVTQAQLARMDNMSMVEMFRLPMLWEHRDIHACAEAVHDEYPGSLQVELMEWLWTQQVPLDMMVVPMRSSHDFIGYQVRMADLNTWAIGLVSATNFGLKWFVGRPRPEEVAYKISTGELTAADGVPEDLISDIKSMKLTKEEDFTAYPEGCPRHPAWPAMHSAASSASFWLAVLLDLTPEQYCEALRVDYAVAFARTIAGVHYPSDNIAGLNLGQILVAEKLPEYMELRYGSNRAAVQAKVDSLRFDWAHFDPNTCSTSKLT